MHAFARVSQVATLATCFLVCTLSAAVCSAEPPAESSAQYTPGPLLGRMLEGPMAGLDEIVFAVRVPGRDHWYVTFGNYADHSDNPRNRGFKKEDGVYWGYGEGGRLCRLNLRTGGVKVILQDPAGGVRDPQVHYDGEKILFAYRKGGTHPFHLCEINVDGSRLRQLTDGPDDDIEPIYCPDDSIIFCSSRCRRFVNCWFTRVATLYRCDGDGGNLRMLSSNCDHDNTPWVLPDGRVLYMRWEYVDRSQVHYHHLWTMSPDGTGQMVYFGNLHGGVAMLDAKPIPGTNKVVSSFSPGHGRPEHYGHVTVIDPSKGPDERGMARNLGNRSSWKDPFALSEDCFLVASRQSLYVMDGEGNTEEIYRLADSEKRFEVHEPRPLRAHPRELVIPARTRLDRPTGRLILEDVYKGRKMDGVVRGSITKLLVLQQLPKPVNFSGGMEPLTIGGTFTLPELLGTVPVEADGSAYMELPALKPVFFVAMDKDNRPVKRMHSFVIVQPGETSSCVGCHEQRVQTPHAKLADLAAMQRPPSKIERVEGMPQVFDFPRDVQPILDKHCVECHNADRRDGRVDLTGDKTGRYTMSYWTIRERNLVADGRNQPASNHEPYSGFSAASRLMKLIDGSHYDARLSEREVMTVRLWIETSATYPGTYAALGCGMYRVQLPREAISQRCAACHGKPPVRTFSISSTAHPKTLCNVSRPEKSLILRAPLSKEAGGLALCEEEVFADVNDPLYVEMLAAVQRTHEELQQNKRFDMPGFRPNEHYIREMQRFGFLPADLKPDDPINVYEVDRAYWDSFDYRPPK